MALKFVIGTSFRSLLSSQFSAVGRGEHKACAKPTSYEQINVNYETVLVICTRISCLKNRDCKNRFLLIICAFQVRNVTALSIKDVLASQPIVEVDTLKNGFRVAAEDNGRPTATIGVWIETGSRYENEKNNGVAHFLERLMHKGTNNRSSSNLENELDAIGAKLKSYTTRDRTGVYVQCSSQDVEKVVDILADVLRNTKLDPVAVEEERKLLLRELEEYEDNFQMVVMDNLHSAAFQGTPMARSPLGTTASLNEITSKDLKEWQEDNYRPVRMVLSAVGGDCSCSKITRLAEKYFADLSNQYPRKVPEARGIRFTGSEYRYRNDYIPHMYSAVAVEGVGYGHKDALALQIANQFIGQWDVTHATTLTAPSRLIQKISHNCGLHYLQHFSLHYKDTGLFGVYFVSDGDDVMKSHEIMQAIQHEWKHLATSVSEEETTLARNQLRTALYSQLETNSQKAEYNAMELLYTNSVRSLADIENEISRIDPNRLKEAVFRHVYDRDTANVGVGLTEAFMSYTLTRTGMSWWRL
ncbi:peptidase, M16 family [Dictyocaulus viviparus]|uniref:Peptidase, M16 family n=1 Tax=Dictyocaulus viviparus TaxID=29172 RepID=A0A0D8XW07_DICVI|nr:peptidase, M16 family [Dictyocaulus viviparus]